MTKRTKAIITSYFNAEDKPVEANFADFVDTSMQGYGGFLVAASDAPQVWIDHADYTCDGTNDEIQIQAAIDALPAAGGVIHLSPGNFSICQVGTMAVDPHQGYCILLYNTHGAVKIEGCGWNTVIKLADNQPALSCMILIRGEVATKRTNPTIIRHIKFDGNDDNQPAWSDFSMVEIAYSTDVLIEDCCFINPCASATRCYRSSERVVWNRNYIDGSNGKNGIRCENYYCIISNNYIKVGNDVGSQAGIEIAVNADINVESRFVLMDGNWLEGGRSSAGTSGRYSVITNNFFFNHVWSSSVAFTLQSYSALAGNHACTDNIVAHNVFYNIRQGIQLGGLDGYICTRNLITDNLVIEGPDINLANGIFESGSYCDANVIENNIINGATTAITKVGTSTKIRNNIGFITENSGTATVANGATTAVVTHGLDVTPVAGDVVVTPTNNLGNATKFWIDTYTATQFTIHVDSDPGIDTATFAWKAIVL